MLGYPMFGKRLERRWGQHNATLAGDCFEVSYLIASAFPNQQFRDAKWVAKNFDLPLQRVYDLTRRKVIAEAQTELALCYWRTGEYNEARDILNEALSLLTTHSEVKAKAVIRLANRPMRGRELK